ncbi:hypothetical protein [Novosphingobium huizhouense]|uniref:hypothetical protein n=1 Tax=Novosphingobium huizhouense TaxID=2866625 RepID=UPI001CD8648B|nr:hypothetical protein [Novosphingobium huizhouense]
MISAATAVDRVFALLVHAAEAHAPCPKNDEICGAIGASSTATAARMLDRLQAEGRIEVQRGNCNRVVTICATGKRTAGTVEELHWRLRDPVKAARAQEPSRATITRDGAAPPMGEPSVPAAGQAVVPCFFCGIRSDIGCRHLAIPA